MPKGPTAKRYAQALFELAQQQNAAEAWLTELDLIASALSEETVATFLSSPRATAEEKQAIVAQATAGREPTIAKFAGLLTERHGLGLIGDIAEAFAELLDSASGRVHADVTTATALSPEQEQRLKQSLGTALNKEIVIATHQDPDLIGGLVVRVGDEIIDGSVKTKLASMKQRLAQESIR